MKTTCPSFESQKRYYGKRWDIRRKHRLLYRLHGNPVKDLVISRIKEIRPTKSKQHTLKIIDSGCGSGWLTKVLSEYGDVIGVDLAVEAARELYPCLKFKQINIV